MLQNFGVLNFRVKIFSWSRIPTKIFFFVDGIKSIVRSQVSEGVQTVCCIRGYHAAVGELLARERELKNAVGTYCGSKDRRFIGP